MQRRSPNRQRALTVGACQDGISPSHSGRGSVLAIRVSCAPPRGRAVQVRIELDLARSRDDVWREISDLPRFLTVDPFHEQIVLMRKPARAGVDIAIAHRVLGHRFFRFGRILRWREQEHYLFSDLSRHGPKRGFPHVFDVRLTPLTRTLPGPLCRLSIEVRGKWTSRAIPVWLGRHWLRLVCGEHARLLAGVL